MNLTLEKEKIKKEIDLIDDERIIKAIKKLLAEYDSDESPLDTVNDSPIEDWEMATPMGRTPTSQQLEEWLDRHEKDDENMTPEEALAFMKNSLAERREKRKGK
jgi:hypothetical protein